MDWQPDVIVFATKPQVMDDVVPAYARFAPGALFLAAQQWREAAEARTELAAALDSLAQRCRAAGASVEVRLIVAPSLTGPVTG